MKNKILRAFLLSIPVAILAAAGFVVFRITKDRGFLEAAVAAGILLAVLLLVDVCFAVVAVRERRRLRRKDAPGQDTAGTGKSEEGND